MRTYFNTIGTSLETIGTSFKTIGTGFETMGTSFEPDKNGFETMGTSFRFLWFQNSSAVPKVPVVLDRFKRERESYKTFLLTARIIIETINSKFIKLFP